MSYTKNSANNLIIALDGPSGVGKGLIGRSLADQLNLQYFQSSIVYRALAYKLKQLKIDLNDQQAIISLSKTINVKNFEDKDLGDEIIGSIASQVAAIAEVRQNLSGYLKQIIYNNPRLIMEGRDIGTQIIPKADLKIFLTANPEVRAQRRYKQLKEMGKNVILAEILAQLTERDSRDAARSVAPLAPAKDAKIIDTSEATPSEIITQIIKLLEAAKLF